MRLLSTAATNKNDPNDARSVAIAALRAPSPVEVHAEDHTAMMKVWARRHRDLSSLRTQVACRLHAVLCELIPGGYSVWYASTRECKIPSNSLSDSCRSSRSIATSTTSASATSRSPALTLRSSSYRLVVSGRLSCTSSSRTRLPHSTIRASRQSARKLLGSKTFTSSLSRDKLQWIIEQSRKSHRRTRQQLR